MDMALRAVGLLWGGHLSCKEKFRWVQNPHGPNIEVSPSGKALGFDPSIFPGSNPGTSECPCNPSGYEPVERIAGYM